MLTLQVKLVAEENAGLLGGDWEYKPHLAEWASFTSHRVPRHSGTLSTSAPIPVGPYSLPSSTTPLRGDEAIHLKMMAVTKHSGIDSIDVSDKGRVERSVQSGTVRLPLVDLLLAAQENRTMEVRMEDPQLTMSKLNELRNDNSKKNLTAKQMEDCAAFVAYKGTLLVTPQLSSPSAIDLVEKLKRAASTESDSKLMYGSPKMIAAMQKMQEMLLTAYSNDFYGRVKAEDGSVDGPPTYPLGAETSLDHMHLPLFYSELGVLPPVAMTQHTIETRENNPALAKEHYAPSRESALMANKLLASSGLRSGLSSEQMVSAIRSQLTQSRSDESISAAYVEAEMAIADMATATGNAIKYMKDYRYPNKQSINMAASAAPTNAVNALSPNSPLRITLAVARTLRKCGAYGWYLAGAFKIKASTVTTEGGKEVKSYETEVESLESLPLYGIAGADDCEGSSQMSSHVLRNLPRLATVVSRKEAPLLHAAADVVRLRVVADVVSSVSAAFVDTSGNKLSREETRAIKDLPLIGDDLDTRREVGGHCHGLWLSRPTVAAAIERSSSAAQLKRDLPELACDYSAWEKRLPTHVLEGTASSDPLVLPAGEVAAAIMTRSVGEAAMFEGEATARKAFLTSLLTPPTTPGIKEPNPLLEYTHMEGLSFYTHAQDPQRRVSSFYMGVSHLLLPELYMMHPLYGQLSVVNPKEMTRGGELGKLLRMPFSKTTPELAFVPTFGRIKRSEWDSVMRPVMASIQNQMPLAANDVFSNTKEAEMASLRVAHVIPPSVLTALGETPLPVNVSLDRHVMGVQHRLDKVSSLHHQVLPFLAHCHGHPSTATKAFLHQQQQQQLNDNGSSLTLPFFVSSSELGETWAMSSLVKQLDRMQAEGKIKHFTFVSDRPLLIGDDVVTLIVSLPSV